MRIFVLWRRHRDPIADLSPKQVNQSLQNIFKPLFDTQPRASIVQNLSIGMVYLELPVRGWKPPFFEEDEHTWALAIEYPVNVRAVLAAHHVNFDRDCVLPPLGRALQTSASDLLKDLAPPFSMVWGDKQSGQTFLQNDGLGQSQVYELQSDLLWAVSNKINAFRALSFQLETEPAQWAVRSTLGWFPLDMTGYRKIRYLKPATQLRVDIKQTTRNTHDVLSDWLRPVSLSTEDALELARHSLLDHLRTVDPLIERPSAGLSGGWDSRAIVSSLRALDMDFALRVRGLPTRHDVILARELARIAGLKLKIKTTGGLPPGNADACRHCIKRALLWQAGHMHTNKNKTFLATQPYLDGGVVNIMGQHGEIGRGYYARKIQTSNLNTDQYGPQLVGELMKTIPPFIKETCREIVRHVIETAYQQADQYGLTGLARLHFFYLYERTRRWASGSLNAQSGVVITPFLNPGYIRAAFSWQEGPKQLNPFHRHIVTANAPDWTGVPYGDELNTSRVDSKLAYQLTEPPNDTDWRRPMGKYKYDNQRYWQVVGKPIIDDALADDECWAPIFDKALAIRQWQAAPDELAMMHLLPEMVEKPGP